MPSFIKLSRVSRTRLSRKAINHFIDIRFYFSLHPSSGILVYADYPGWGTSYGIIAVIFI